MLKNRKRQPADSSESNGTSITNGRKETEEKKGENI
jgi:hypothetical protein